MPGWMIIHNHWNVCMSGAPRRLNTAHFLLDGSICPVSLCRMLVLVFHCITVCKQPLQSLHKQYYRAVWYTWLAITWDSTCGNIQRHRWAALPLVDASDGHRVSSTKTQVVECVWGDSAEQIRVLCGVGLHIVNGELQVQAMQHILYNE